MRRPTRKIYPWLRNTVAAAAVPLLSSSSCVPEDVSRERSAIEIRMSVSANVTGLDVELERMIVSASATVPDCHLIYYVERPALPLVIADLRTPYAIQHRSISNSSCKVLAGFSDLTGVPTTRDVSDEEKSWFYAKERGVTAGVAVDAKMTYRGQIKRLHVVLTALRGTTTTFMQLSPGGVALVGVNLDLSGFFRGPQGSLLPYYFRGDINDDGVVDTEELTGLFVGAPQSGTDYLRRVAQENWRIYSIRNNPDGGSSSGPTDEF